MNGSTAPIDQPEGFVLSCSNCRFWEYSWHPCPGGIKASCHRRAPVADVEQGAHFPLMPAEGWCGEHESKPVEGRL